MTSLRGYCYAYHRRHLYRGKIRSTLLYIQWFMVKKEAQNIKELDFLNSVFCYLLVPLPLFSFQYQCQFSWTILFSSILFTVLRCLINQGFNCGDISQGKKRVLLFPCLFLPLALQSTGISLKEKKEPLFSFV